MRKLALILFSALSLASSSAFAASYQQVSGAIIDPIQCFQTCVGDHPYSGINLEPGVVLTYADLSNADLNYADLNSADLTGSWLAAANLNGADLSGANLGGGMYFMFADLTGANLSGSDLGGAILEGADLTGANLSGADLGVAYMEFAILAGTNLSGANLANAMLLSTTSGAAFYDINTDFTGTGFDPVAAGWTLVPEPSTALLMGLGLAGLASRRR